MSKHLIRLLLRKIHLLPLEKAKLFPEESTVKLVNLLVSLVLVCAGVFMLNYVKPANKEK